MNETRFPTTIELSPDEDHAGDLIVDDQRHQLKVVVQQSDAPGADFANLFFSSREALYDFALSLLRDAVFGNVMEMHTPNSDGKYTVTKHTIGCCREILSYDLNDGQGIRVIDGVRLAADSARLNIYAEDKLKD